MIIQQYFSTAHGNHGNVIDLDRVFRWRHQMFDLHLTSFVRLLCRPCAKPRICNHPQAWITAAKTCNSITFPYANYKVFAAFTLACFAKRLILLSDVTGESLVVVTSQKWQISRRCKARFGLGLWGATPLQRRSNCIQFATLDFGKKLEENEFSDKFRDFIICCKFVTTIFRLVPNFRLLVIYSSFYSAIRVIRKPSSNSMF